MPLQDTHPTPAFGGFGFRRDSGPHRGSVLYGGGRATVRSALYMGVVVASRRNNALREFYQRLLEADKTKKVALTVCTRDFCWPILNSMVRMGQRREPIIPMS